MARPGLAWTAPCRVSRPMTMSPTLLSARSSSPMDSSAARARSSLTSKPPQMNRRRLPTSPSDGSGSRGRTSEGTGRCADARIDLEVRRRSRRASAPLRRDARRDPARKDALARLPRSAGRDRPGRYLPDKGRLRIIRPRRRLPRIARTTRVPRAQQTRGLPRASRVHRRTRDPPVTSARSSQRGRLRKRRAPCAMIVTMAYDEDLANRIRELIAAEDGYTEQKMFGGIGFMIDGHMAVGVSGEGGLMIHCSKEETEALLAKPGARPFEMRGRELKGWLRVDAESVSTKRALEPWAMQSVAFARALPPKEKK